jgi:hypothetical protein
LSAMALCDSLHVALLIFIVPVARFVDARQPTIE